MSLLQQIAGIDRQCLACGTGIGVAVASDDGFCWWNGGWVGCEGAIGGDDGEKRHRRGG